MQLKKNKTNISSYNKNIIQPQAIKEDDEKNSHLAWPKWQGAIAANLLIHLEVLGYMYVCISRSSTRNHPNTQTPPTTPITHLRQANNVKVANLLNKIKEKKEKKQDKT